MPTIWYVVFDKVQKIRINKNYQYKKLRNLIKWDLSGFDGSDFLEDYKTYATCNHNGIKFEANTAGYSGNGTEFAFLDEDTTDNVVIERITGISNVYGGSNVRWIISYGPRATTQDVIDALDAYDIANPGHIDFSYTLVVDKKLNNTNKKIKNLGTYTVESTSISLFGSNRHKYNYTKDLFLSNPVMLEGGMNSRNYILFNYDIDTDGTRGLTPRKILINWRVDGETASIQPIGVNGSYTDTVNVNILSTDTTAQVVDKTVFTILGTSFYSDIPLLAIQGDECVYFKIGKHSNIPLTLTKDSQGFPGKVYSIHEFVNFYDTVKEGDDLVLELDKNAFNMSYQSSMPINQEGNILYGTNPFSKFRNIAIGSNVFGTTDYDNLKKIIFTDSVFEEDDLGGTLLFKNASYLGFEYYTSIIDIRKEGQYYINQDLELRTAYEGLFYFDFFSNIPIEEIVIDYKSNSHAGAIIEDILDFYNITKYSSADLTTLRESHPNFQGGIIIDDQQILAKSLKMVTESFNLYTFIDKEGNIRFKFYNCFDTTTPNSIDFYSVESIEQDILEIKNTKYDLFINKNYYKDYSELVSLTQPFINSLSTLLEWEEVKELESVIMRDFFSESFDGRTYEELFNSKLLSKIEEVSILGNLNLMTYELGDLINIENYDKLDSSNSYKIVSIETNGFQSKINAIRIIENDIDVYLIDENGDFITDEFGNYIIA